MRTVSARLHLPAVFLLGAAQLLVACSDSSSPQQIPQIAGRYLLTESVTATTCTPEEPPAGGTVRMDAFSGTYEFQVEQTGSTVTLHQVGFPEESETGTIDADGKISISAQGLFEEEEPREGNRVFFVDLTIQRELQVESATQIAGSVTYVNVFHEGSSDAPIYATCSREGTTVLVRTDDLSGASAGSSRSVSRSGRSPSGE